MRYVTRLVQDHTLSAYLDDQYKRCNGWPENRHQEINIGSHKNLMLHIIWTDIGGAPWINADWTWQSTPCSCWSCCPLYKLGVYVSNSSHERKRRTVNKTQQNKLPKYRKSWWESDDEWPFWKIGVWRWLEEAQLGHQQWVGRGRSAAGGENRMLRCIFNHDQKKEFRRDIHNMTSRRTENNSLKTPYDHTQVLDPLPTLQEWKGSGKLRRGNNSSEEGSWVRREGWGEVGDRTVVGEVKRRREQSIRPAATRWHCQSVMPDPSQFAQIWSSTRFIYPTPW